MARMLFIFFQLLLFVVYLYFLPDIVLEDIRCTNPLEEVCDSIHYASQVGRLDLVTFFLALIGTIFVIAGIIGYSKFQKGVDKKVSTLVKKRIQKMLADGELGNAVNETICTMLENERFARANIGDTSSSEIDSIDPDPAK